jgi:uncharacterized protein
MDLSPLKQTLCGIDHAITCAYLFGSQARGDAGDRSDVDIAILLTQAPLPTLEGLRFDIAATIENVVRRPVDLVVLNNAPVDLIHRVLRDGILILERDRAARIRFEVKARNEYFDLLPFLERYRHGNREHTV